MNRSPLAYSVDSRDIRSCLTDFIDLKQLFGFERYSHLEPNEIDRMLAQAERMAVDVISPLNSVADRDPPRYEAGKVVMPAAFHPAYRTYREGGWISIGLEKEAGGAGLPLAVTALANEILTGACGGFSAFASLTFGALHLIHSFGTEDLQRKFVGKMMRGEFTGTMCLTEPHAGSFLADITTRAKPNGDHFLIRGTKVFIGTGEHDLCENKVHCVLARIEGAPGGYKGISLFAVPKYRVNEDGSLGAYNDVFCGGIASKTGHQGGPTAILHFGDNDDCRGWLLGQEGQGLAHMFQMMNEARLGIGVQGVAQAAGAYQAALAYAKQRVQGLPHKRRAGAPDGQVRIIEHPDVRRNLMFMKAAVEGCRRLNVQTGLYIDLSKVSRDPVTREYYADLIEIITPILKSYAGDMGFRVTETAVQVLGGCGYTKDYPVEQYMRDVKVASIYEGTNGIQGIDLQRRKLTIKDGQLFRNLLTEIETFTRENAVHPTLGPSVRELDRAKDTMVAAARSFPPKREEDPSLPLSVAKPFLDLSGHVLCTWMLLKSAVIAEARLSAGKLSEADQAFYRGKTLTARFAVANFLPQADALAQTIAAWDRSLLDIEEAAF